MKRRLADRPNPQKNNRWWGELKLGFLQIFSGRQAGPSQSALRGSSPPPKNRSPRFSSSTASFYGFQGYYLVRMYLVQYLSRVLSRNTVASGPKAHSISYVHSEGLLVCKVWCYFPSIEHRAQDAQSVHVSLSTFFCTKIRENSFAVCLIPIGSALPEICRTCTSEYGVNTILFFMYTAPITTHTSSAKSPLTRISTTLEEYKRECPLQLFGPLPPTDDPVLYLSRYTRRDLLI